MIKSKILGLVVLTFFCFNSATFAEDANYTLTPANFLVLENDLGQKLAITVKNNTDKEIKLNSSECVAEKVDGVYQKRTQEVIKSYLELDEPTITLKANAEGTIVTRVRISANGGSITPCIYTKLIAINGKQVTEEPLGIVTYTIQNFSGEHKLDVDLDIGASGLVTSSVLKIKGAISNTGEKFFNPSAIVTISKNNTKLFEQDVTEQVAGLLMPGESRSYELAWINTLTDMDSVGEYQIEIRVSSDQDPAKIVKKIIYNFIPLDYIILGGIASGALFLIIIGIIVLKKR